MSSSLGSTFLDRARYEADRYGSDAWVFVRELLQNARDAGAGRVWFEVDRSGGRDRIVCRDDGEGMSFAHARKYLFTLYASSKRGRKRTAGRFGIGFWSVLRFIPDVIIVRSRAARGEGWQLRLDGDLGATTRESVEMARGTEVTLERPESSDDLETSVRDAVLRDAPFLSRRGPQHRPLEVLVNSRKVRSEMELPPPSLTFRRRGLRGVVGLGPEPRAEVFAHGLRVRDAANLDELLLTGGARRRVPSMASKGFAPKIVIDSAGLSVLLARGDAREDRALRRLVSVGYRELGRLVRAELDRHSRLRLPSRIWEHVRGIWSTSRVPRVAAAVAALGVAGVIAWRVVVPALERSGEPVRNVSPATVAAGDSVLREPYRDLKTRYRGPSVSLVQGRQTAIGLRYRPAGGHPYFAALLIPGLEDDGKPVGDPEPGATGDYRGAACADECLDVEMVIDAGAGVFRVPVATGHVIDPESVRLNGRRVFLLATRAGEPALLFETSARGRLDYRSSERVLPNDPGVGPWPDLPVELQGDLRGISTLAYGDRPRAAVGLVGRLIVYDTSPETAARYAEARRGSSRLFESTLEIGAGDCDVQNALLAALLNRAGVPARLAVGWIGREGAAVPGLHAWVEYQGVDGMWRVADASGGVGSDRPISVSPIDSAPSQAERSSIGEIAALVALPMLVLGLLMTIFKRRLWKRSFRPGRETDLSELLCGALVRPEAFARVDPLFKRPVVPTVDGGRVSLRRVRSAARLGGLACGSRNSRLALRSAASSAVVLDLELREGAAVAAAMGAVDLDHWQQILDRARSAPVASRVEEALLGAGARCRLRLASAAGEDVAILDGRAIGLAGDGYWVVVDEAGLLWSSVRRVAEHRPAEGALLLADRIIDGLGIPADKRDRCLQRLAQDAVHESGGEST